MKYSLLHEKYMLVLMLELLVASHESRVRVRELCNEDILFWLVAI
jgi:hypothetical protein